MTFDEAIAGSKAPQDVLSDLKLVDIDYISFDGKIHAGQLVVHERVAGELREIFTQLLAWKFPIEKVVPVVQYGWSDEDSMADNNTSAFNYRLIYGTNEPSNHSHGLAVDINPRVNPYVAIDGTVFPPGAVYDSSKPGALAAGDRVVSLFENKGWEWGGKWEKKDWQHFQKEALITYRGIIIEESLEDKSVLKQVKIVLTEVEQVTPRHQSDEKQWTMHTVEIPGNKVKAVAELLSKSMKTRWYADYKNDTYHYIIFQNKVFCIDRTSKKQYDEAKQYGISVGIPEHQVDFYPDVKEWER